MKLKIALCIIKTTAVSGLFSDMARFEKSLISLQPVSVFFKCLCFYHIVQYGPVTNRKPPSPPQTTIETKGSTK